MAMAGDGRGLLELSHLYYQRDPKTGHYSNESEANVAINCLDHPDHVQSVTDVQAEVSIQLSAARCLGAGLVWVKNAAMSVATVAAVDPDRMRWCCLSVSVGLARLRGRGGGASPGGFLNR